MERAAPRPKARRPTFRVTITSTGAPFYEPNPQTGAPITHFVTEPGVAALNTIWHDANYASRVILPVVK
jgi:predicted acyl esterase